MATAEAGETEVMETVEPIPGPSFKITNTGGGWGRKLGFVLPIEDNKRCQSKIGELK